MKKTRFVSAFAAAAMLWTGCACAYTLHLPDDLSVIREQAFRDNLSIESVVLPEGLERIESEAFANSGLRSIYCAGFDSIKIAPDAFDDKTFLHFPYPDGRLTAVCGERVPVLASCYPPFVSFT